MHNNRVKTAQIQRNMEKCVFQNLIYTLYIKALNLFLELYIDNTQDYNSSQFHDSSTTMTDFKLVDATLEIIQFENWLSWILISLNIVQF